MELHTVHTGYFKLDGGAMFGVVPKTLWEKLNPPDANNKCTWAMRCLLVEIEDRKILIDSGIGDRQSDKFFSFYEPHGEPSLSSSLASLGLGPEDITDHVLTHLHFDHCGGSIIRDSAGELQPYFPNATYHVSRPQWNSAKNPNPREKASFLPENIEPMEKAAKLNLVPADEPEKTLFPGFKVRFYDGHTDGLMAPVLDYNGQTVVYTADLLPSRYHYKPPYVMAFDIRPLSTMEEKPSFLAEAEQNDYVLFFEHDPEVACARLSQGDKGIESSATFSLEALKTPADKG
jgi:glyoxylase-like metal-dependent hydrolase (beta-lactamase superfamily II)